MGIETSFFSNMIQYKGTDSLFTVIRIVTMASFLLWPILAFLVIMALGGPVNKEKLLQDYAVRGGYLLTLAYPLIFMIIVSVAEKHLIGISYPLAVATALLPALSIVGAAWRLNSGPEYVHEHHERPFAYEQGKDLEFAGFTIEYMGQKRHGQEEATAAVTIDTFKVVEKNDGSEHILRIRSGQTPPTPADFEIDGHRFAITIYEMSDGTRLEPNHLALIKRNP